MAVQSYLNFSAQNGQRGFELMADIGTELMQVPGGNLKTLEHVVEDVDEPAQFISFTRSGNSLVEASLTDGLRHMRNILNRRQCAASHPPSGCSKTDREQREKRDHALGLPAMP